jgi:hypothetical protein
VPGLFATSGYDAHGSLFGGLTDLVVWMTGAGAPMSLRRSWPT